jgi:hypothetical protein
MLQLQVHFVVIIHASKKLHVSMQSFPREFTWMFLHSFSGAHGFSIVLNIGKYETLFFVIDPLLLQKLFTGKA